MRFGGKINELIEGQEGEINRGNNVRETELTCETKAEGGGTA